MPPEFLGFTWHAWLAMAATAAVFITLQVRRGVSTELLLLGAVAVVTLAGVIGPEDALSGFSNSAVLTIGALFPVAAGLQATGLLDWLGQKMLGGAKSATGATLRLALVLVPASAFLLNTAIVAVTMPVVLEWCRRRRVSPSQMLLSVSYFAILGGVCTLIGTSTTLVINGLIRDELARLQRVDTALFSAEQLAKHEAHIAQIQPMGLFEIGAVGLPCAVAGVVFFLLIGRRFLPNRTDMLEQLGDKRREYLVEMLVQPECRLIGRTIEEAGLRHLPGLFLIEIDRAGDVITPVTPQDMVHAGDRLVFTGVVSTIVDLERIPGLVPAVDMNYEFHPRTRQQRHLTEVVLSRTSPLIGVTVREANFRQRYNAAVVAVHRNGVRLTNKIGDIALEPGDTLLLQTRTEFVSSYRNSRDFYLVSAVEGDKPRRHDKALLAAALLLLLVVWLSLSSFLRGVPQLSALGSPPIAALTVAILFIVTGCVRLNDARSSIDLQVLLTVAGALGLGRALAKSGAAERIAHLLVGLAEQTITSDALRPLALLLVIYLVTLIFTELISNTAVAAMLFPLAVAVALASGLNPRPFIMAVTLAASVPFLTPIGYQTNLMVQGPGGYRPLDYLRVGLPMTIIVTIVALVVIPNIWPLTL